MAQNWHKVKKYLLRNIICKKKHSSQHYQQFKNGYNFLKILFIFRERGREEERERGKHQCVVASHTCPHWGPGLQPRPVPWLGIKPPTLWFTGRHSIHWATPARAKNGYNLKLGRELFSQIDFQIFKECGIAEEENLQLMSQSFSFPMYENDIKSYDPNYNFQIVADGFSK